MAELLVRLPEELRQAKREDWRMLGAIIGDAFQDDPVSRWIFGGKRAMPGTFGRQARHLYLQRGICHLAGESGATMWLLPDANKSISVFGTLDIGWHMARTAGIAAVRRGMAAEAEMTRKRPDAPHAYLYTIGVRSQAQGTGLGHRLLAPMLEACDRAGLPAYLENSNPRNHSFYAGHGFAHMEHFEPAPGAPPLEAMWREPR
ncbi:N-acetyltransferase [Parasphingopyxis sp.]|uniref:GNAT family N-acetyltransferase n=1 Tax=Parasphingopyxis sp. TaxID=1920299 RepID=UPI00262679CD|nr:GNAT family N-acetyltransferase [Parasphingopyxis sp.]